MLVVLLLVVERVVRSAVALEASEAQVALAVVVGGDEGRG